VTTVVSQIQQARQLLDDRGIVGIPARRLIAASKELNKPLDDTIDTILDLIMAAEGTT